MSTSMYMSLLALLTVCFSTSTFADCPTSRSTPSNLPLMNLLQTHIHSNESNINIVFLEIANDLPPISQWLDKLYFTGIDQPSPCFIRRGQPFGHIFNANLRRYQLISGEKIITISAYDPRIDLGHPNVYWSVRADGAYKSWNKVNWTKYGRW